MSYCMLDVLEYRIRMTQAAYAKSHLHAHCLGFDRFRMFLGIDFKVGFVHSKHKN